ncbi:hypothetical protein EP7_005617 (plasmid) [Isosphaeraceae bacterium EP7]
MGLRHAAKFAAAVVACRRFGECVEAARASGCHVEARHLRWHADRVETARAAFMEFCPWVDEAMCRESWEQYLAGNYVTLEQAAARLS